MEGTDPTMYERVGGTTAITAVVDELYRRANTDPELAAYFHRTDLDAQRLRLVQMIAEALGGPAAPWLSGLGDAHRGRGVTHRHFSLMAAHLLDILEAQGLAGAELDVLTRWFASGRDAVVDGIGSAATRRQITGSA